MAALIAENFRFLSLFFKSKDVMIFNGLVALGTVGSQELFTVVLSTALAHQPGTTCMGWQPLGCPPWHSSSLASSSTTTPGTWLLSASTGEPRTAQLPLSGGGRGTRCTSET